MFHLLARSVTDLIAAIHLASHAYLQQAYTLIRPVHENCDLVELFAQNAGEAARWIDSEKPGVEFRPAHVRKRIGASAEDAATYGHLSEMGSHPRFAGSRITGMLRVRTDDPADRQVLLRMGSFIEWHPAAVHVYLFAFEAIIRVGFKVRHLEEVTERISHEQWASAFLGSAGAASRGCKLVRLELVELNAADDAEFLDTIYDDLIARLQPDAPSPVGNDDLPSQPPTT